MTALFYLQKLSAGSFLTYNTAYKGDRKDNYQSQKTYECILKCTELLPGTVGTFSFISLINS